MLFRKELPAADLVIRGARVLDPVAGVDAVVDVRVDGGTIAQLGADLDANGHRVVDAAGLVLAPAFVDPHVHLRTPGREDEETIASGTDAAAAGGYCAILAMPNTEPVVDSAAVLEGLVEEARREAVVPTGFLAAITKGQARRGAHGDGRARRPRRGRVHRRRPARRVGRGDAPRAAVRGRRGPHGGGALRGAEPHARRARPRGRRLGRARLRRLPVARREPDGRARPRPRRLRRASDPPHAPVRARVGRGARACARGGRGGDRRGHAAPSRASPTRPCARSTRTGR